MDYDLIGFHADDLVKLDILVTGDKIDALSLIVHRDQGREPRPARSSRSCARKSPATCSKSPSRRPSAAASSPAKPSQPCRKNVTAKCYGGDITRKRKLLEKQKEGKKRMKQVGHVEIPQEPSWPSWTREIRADFTPSWCGQYGGAGVLCAVLVSSMR